MADYATMLDKSRVGFLTSNMRGDFLVSMTCDEYMPDEGELAPFSWKAGRLGAMSAPSTGSSAYVGTLLRRETRSPPVSSPVSSS